MIRLPAFHATTLRVHALAKRPAEAAALVLVRVDHVYATLPVPNVHEEPESGFALDATSLALASWLEASLLGLEVVVFHSHNVGPAVASSGDTRWAQLGGRQLIYSVELDEFRAFTFEPGGRLDRHRLRAVEIPLERV